MTTRKLVKPCDICGGREAIVFGLLYSMDNTRSWGANLCDKCWHRYDIIGAYKAKYYLANRQSVSEPWRI